MKSASTPLAVIFVHVTMVTIETTLTTRVQVRTFGCAVLSETRFNVKTQAI